MIRANKVENLEIQEVQGREKAVNSLRVKFHADIYITDSNSLQNIFNSVVLKDIVKRNNIRDVDLLKRIIAYALSNVGRSFSATGISKHFKAENLTVATETILNYLEACEEAYLLYPLKSQNINGKKVLKVNEKYYAADHGLREAGVGANLQNVEIILENTAGVELFRRGYKVWVGCVGTKEIDFVGEKHGDKLYVQVC